MAYPEKTRYKPINPEKYVGDVNNITMRSSWESKFALWCDTHEKVIKWGSEIKPIPYYSQVDQCMKQYYPDFWIQIEGKDGRIRKVIIEVKPYSQVVKPTTRNKKKLLEEGLRWVKNQDKWKAARAWAQKHGWEFSIMTEYELGIKKR